VRDALRSGLAPAFFRRVANFTKGGWHAVISLLTIAVLALIVAAALLVSWSISRRRSNLGHEWTSLVCVPAAVSPIVTVVKKPP
jgi:ABC-type Fe3+ transport system permease subunit